jgi:putative transposase
MSIFQSAADFAIFMALVRRAVARHGVALHGFALMKTHIHFIVTPHDGGGLPRMMQQISLKYVRYYNRQYERIGPLWSGRYRAIALDTPEYSLTCLRYIDRNPVAAGIVETPESYRWSSYLATGFGEWPIYLTPHPAYLALGDSVDTRADAYRRLCGAEIDAMDLADLQRQDLD